MGVNAVACLIALPTINLEVVSNERAETMSLIFTAQEFRAMTRREFYRVALRAVLETGRCIQEHEDRLILQLRREESACR
jgi:hypothetical protein